ncbi:unnamed protein product [Rhizopus stolonifer]
MLVYLPFIIFINLASCLRTEQANDDPRWPVLYYSDEPYFELYNPNSSLSGYIEMAQGGAYLKSNESYLLSATENVITFDQNSAVAKEFMFISSLCTTTNCRESLDHWDCPKCPQLVPDGVVVRSFQTYPNEVTGFILRSKRYKALFVQVRGANSDKNRILWSKRKLVEHPTIPDIHVHEGKKLDFLLDFEVLKTNSNYSLGYLTSALDIRDIIATTIEDQLIIHPDYRVIVIGHSFGAGVASLVAVHLQLDFPDQLNRRNFKAYTIAKPRVGDYYYSKLVYDLDINLIRIINALDEAPHRPSILRGYVHEGDEYWLQYYNKDELLIKFCPGPFESKSCSNSSPYFSALEHSAIFGIQQACFPTDLLSANFTHIMEKINERKNS